LLVALLRAPPLATGLALSAAVPVLLGFAYPIEEDHVRYELVSYVVSAALPAIAMSAIVARTGARWAWPAFGVALLAVVAMNLRTNADLLGHKASGADFLIGRVRAFTPPNAIVVAQWAFATPLAYAEFVDRSLGERVVVTGNPDEFREFVPIWTSRRPVVLVTTEPFEAQRLQLRRLDAFANPPLLRVLSVR
jgi:hypothetical protein